jgi:hypothetical protein
MLFQQTLVEQPPRLRGYVAAPPPRNTSHCLDVEWIAQPELPKRVHKSIRMRIRYTCHNCETTFGREKVCEGCSHRRCRRCARSPPLKDQVSLKAVLVDTQTALLTPAPTTIVSDMTTCHECHTELEITIEACPSCSHQICDRCRSETTLMPESMQPRPSPSVQTSSPASVAPARICKNGTRGTEVS